MAEATSTGGNGSTLSGGQVNDPVSAIVKGVVDIGNNLVNNLFGASIAKKKLALQEKEQQFQQSLSGLSNQQSYVLNQQLATAKNDTERYSILTNAVLQIKLQQQQNSTSSSNNKIYLIIAIAAIALIALIVVNRK